MILSLGIKTLSVAFKSNNTLVFCFQESLQKAFVVLVGCYCYCCYCCFINGFSPRGCFSMSPANHSGFLGFAMSLLVLVRFVLFHLLIYHVFKPRVLRIWGFAPGCFCMTSNFIILRGHYFSKLKRRKHEFFRKFSVLHMNDKFWKVCNRWIKMIGKGR